MRLPTSIQSEIASIIEEAVASNEGPTICANCKTPTVWSYGDVCAECYIDSAMYYEQRGGMTSELLCGSRLDEDRHPRLYNAAMTVLWNAERAALAAASVPTGDTLTALLADLVRRHASSGACGRTILTDLYKMLGYTFHPDESAANIINIGDGTPTFTPTQAALVDTLVTLAAADGTDLAGVALDVAVELGEMEADLPDTTPPAGFDDDHMSHPVDQYGRRILTVGLLRSYLDGLPDDTHVVLDDTDGWYVNVDAVATPLGDGSPWSALTLFPGTPFDTRQV